MISNNYKEFYCEEKDVLSYIKEKGVAVIKDVLSKEEIMEARKGLWNTLEHLTDTSYFPQTFKFDDKKTWGSFLKLNPLHGMLVQYYSIGHSQFVWDIRQNPKVVKIFSKIWNTSPDKLLVSFDGLSCHLSPEITGKHYFKGKMWEHVDQSYINSDFTCVQGMITLWDCNEGDATLYAREGSNKLHAEFGRTFVKPFTSLYPEKNKALLQKIKQNKKDGKEELNINLKDELKLLKKKMTTFKSDWYRIKDEKQREFYKDCPVVCVKASAGSLIMWDSRTLHQGVECQKNRKQANIRGVVYVCYTPRSRATNRNLQKKIKAFNEMRLTTHWPAKVKLFPKKPRIYPGQIFPVVKPLPPPKLTELGKKLAGF